MTNQLDYSFYEGFELDGFIYGFPDSNGEPHTLTNATDFDGTFIGEPISHPEVYPDTGQDAHITPEGHIIKDTYTGRNFSTRSTGSSSVPELRPTRKRKMDQMLTTERELGCPIFEAEILNEPRTKPTCRGLAAPDMSKNHTYASYRFQGQAYRYVRASCTPAIFAKYTKFWQASLYDPSFPSKRKCLQGSCAINTE
ncbi:hypothetical protein PTT_13153 [Pyrenophora teres f. teres 0-1]|uniref:Uncharacterized protein n=1 Tax=Pyrenophora teres f. teres (strain 0-1) TaxID=861557 RepID=E3RVG2_PYRTT|nr:hypothetical protein PTT_13153 [Pyrenophora teres f. teres 0-1]